MDQHPLELAGDEQGVLGQRRRLGVRPIIDQRRASGAKCCRRSEEFFSALGSTAITAKSIRTGRRGLDTVESVVHLVREPTLDDAAALGRVHVRAWQAAYGNGLLPAAYLESLDETERATLWTQWLSGGARPRSAWLVGVADSGDVAGFINVGPAAGAADMDDGEVDDGEVYAINVDPGQWGTGLGHDLFVAGCDALIEFGFTRAVLWVHRDNERARTFYARHGWEDDGVKRVDEVFGVKVPEVRYSVDLGKSSR